jgi:hypothetical protein
MAFRNWLTKKASRTAETVITQTRETLQKNVENHIVEKGNAAFTLGKLVLLGLIFALTMKEIDGVEERMETKPSPIPTNITINNYMNERKEDHD